MDKWKIGYDIPGKEEAFNIQNYHNVTRNSTLLKGLLGEIPAERPTKCSWKHFKLHLLCYSNIKSILLMHCRRTDMSNQWMRHVFRCSHFSKWSLF